MYFARKSSFKQKFPTTPLSNSCYYFNQIILNLQDDVKTKTNLLLTPTYRVALSEKGIRCWVQSKDKIAAFIPNYELS